jgi:putative Mn2+ efflux pump MntP
MDAFAVAVAATSAGFANDSRATFRLSFHFGFFQFLMPLIGWLLGSTVAVYIDSADHWIAFGLLGIIGGRMVWGGLSSSSESLSKGDPTRGWSLVILSIATSIDALAVGMSLAFLNTEIWQPCVVIGLVAAAMTLVGIKCGRFLGNRFGKKMELVGGVILIGIGVKIVVEHLGIL